MFMLAQKNSHRWQDFNNDANWNTCTGNVANSPLSEKLEGSKEESVIQHAVRRNTFNKKKSVRLDISLMLQI